MKQEYKVESLNTYISELQQQTYAQRLDLEDAHHGYVESRREQVRLQEELVVKEKALRDTQIRSNHEIGDVKRAQEFRADDFSVQKLREIHDTIQRLTSSTRVARRGKLHEWFWRNSRKRIQLQWTNFSRNQSTSSHSKSSFYAHPRKTLATWHMESVWTTGKLFWQSTPCVRFTKDTLPRNIPHSRATCRKSWRTNWEHDCNADDCKKAVNHESLSYQRKFHIIRWLEQRLQIRYRSFS